MNALPTQPSYQRDQTEQPPNTAADQYGRVRRTTEAISAAGRDQDADWPAHGFVIIDGRLCCRQGSDLGLSAPEQLSLAQQLRQLGDIHRNPPRLILAEQLGGRASARFILVVEIRDPC
jgi:hypothetical protein